MRILLTVHQFLPDYSTGTEVLALGVAQELVRRGHHVEVFTGHPASQSISTNDRIDDYVFEGIPVSRFHHAFETLGRQTNFFESEYENDLVARHFERMLDRFAPEVVHFFHLMRISASPVGVCARRGIPTFYTPTDFWFICPTCQLRLPDGTACAGPDDVAANCVRHLMTESRAPAARLLDGIRNPTIASRVVRVTRRMGSLPIPAVQRVAAISNRPAALRARLREIDVVLPPTQLMLKALVEFGLDPGRATLMPFGVPDNRAAPRHRDPEAALRMGFIGTLSEHKGAHVLIDAVRRIPQAAVRVDIYGRESDFPAYARRLRDLSAGDERVRFAGTFPREEIERVLGSLDLLIVPSTWSENTPLVIYSAQAAGCPVIASDVEGIAEAVGDGRSAVLVPAGDPEALARAIMGVVSDPQRLESMAKSVPTPPSLRDYVDRLVDLYRLGVTALTA